MIPLNISPCVKHARRHESAGLTPAYVDPEYVFTYIAGGDGFFLLEEGKLWLKAGDCILLPPYMLHIINTEEGRPMIQEVIHFDLVETTGLQERIKKDAPMNFDLFKADTANPENMLCDAPRVSHPNAEARHALERLIAELKEEFDGNEWTRPLALKSHMLEILRMHLRAATTDESAKASRPQVWRNLEKALKFIQENFDKPIELEEMAKASGLSPNYFCKLFTDYTACPPHKYLNTVRVKEAKLLIDEGEQNFTQIAESCGFGSIHLFSKIFRRIEGKTPSKYKAGG